MSLAVPAAPASAHGIGGEAADRSVLGFVPLGIEHMLLGWDHLLFIAGVVLVARDVRRAAKLITLFVVGHSTTLIVASLAGWQVSAAAVDVVIAVSVVFVGAVALFVKRPRWELFGYIVLGFGLVHGLGLSTRLQDLGLPEDGMIWRVVAFNVGVEIGQLTAILAMYAVGMLVALRAGDARRSALRTIVAAGLFVAGTTAAAVLGFTASTGEETVPAASDEGGCTIEDRTEQFPAMGGHAGKSFYGPDEEAPLDAFGHSLGDGYVVVLYPSQMSTEDVQELRTFIEGSNGILAGADPQDTTDVKTINAYETLTCTHLDVEAIEEFSAAWFEEIGA